MDSVVPFFKKFTFFGILCALLVGCAPKQIYSWGSYENSLYALYSETESYNIDRDLSILSTEIQRTVQSGHRVPPGKSAHVGYLHYLRGNKELALKFFQEEKRSFPESAVFIDGMIARMK